MKGVSAAFKPQCQSHELFKFFRDPELLQGILSMLRNLCSDPTTKKKKKWFYFLNLNRSLGYHMPLVKDVKSVIYALKNPFLPFIFQLMLARSMGSDSRARQGEGRCQMCMFWRLGHLLCLGIARSTHSVSKHEIMRLCFLLGPFQNSLFPSYQPH